MIGMTCGATICAWNCSSDHPWPNANRSSCTSATPHARSCRMAHSPAASMAGEPVTRGPYTSLSQPASSMTCDRCRPSSRMAATIAWSGACAAAGSAGATARLASAR